jgi:pimeloyl-ACP methyl ester carboxylesterase
MTNPLLTDRLLRSMVARKESAAPWVATIQQPMRRRGTTAAYAAWLPALFATDDGGLSRRSAELRLITVPVALIWGEADTVTPIAQGEEIARLVRARSFARLPGVGHIPHIEDEAGFLAALDAALAEEGGR